MNLVIFSHWKITREYGRYFAKLLLVWNKQTKLQFRPIVFASGGAKGTAISTVWFKKIGRKSGRGGNKCKMSTRFARTNSRDVTVSSILKIVRGERERKRNLFCTRLSLGNIFYKITMPDILFISTTLFKFDKYKITYYGVWVTCFS